ncbi:contact-dependent growth inhibition system immunity protein [Paenibacillus taiwanensis]|uniref:contact-dependent growth inhibition system immunity protein n=1 Tax=Paenibacillus taiwanensis TaxID=401638 RepID=UPI00048E9E3C|nr:contact-dependent growth inhibition system immunity protein [Paenibacillus taiwanensis]
MNKTIKDFYLLNQQKQTVETEYALDNWYNRLIDKTEAEVDLTDVCKMLLQNVFIEIAIKKAMDILDENPIAGDMYDGQVLELLYSVNLTKFEDLCKLRMILKKINIRLSSLEWSNEEDRKEYSDILENFMRIVHL